jgi:hypothetical protein
MIYEELNEIYVDAGCFVVGDKEFFLKHGGDEERMKQETHGYIVKCNPGNHKVTYEMDESWNLPPKDEDDEWWSPERESHIMNILSGELWIVDACYVIKDELWDKFINENYLDVDDDRHFTINTGGDGEFNIRLWVY